MKGKIDILVATQYYNSKFVQIFRILYYDFVPNDLTTQTKEAEIYRLLKDNVSRINTFIDDDDIQGIMRNLRHISTIYTFLPEYLGIIQKRMPRLLITFYEKIETLGTNIDRLVEYYMEMDAPDLLTNLLTVREILRNAEGIIMEFWKESPEIFFRMPLRITEKDSTVELFETERFLPYIMGSVALPLWTDPVTISVINETRKRIQTKEQTKICRENYFVLLRLITQRTRFDWAIKLIIKYLPIPLVFDLMVSQTPWEFSLCNERKLGEIFVQVT